MRRSSRWCRSPNRTAPNGLTIHTASQSPSFVRAEVSRLLGWAENRVRVRTAHLGGGFGAKLYIKLEALVAVCALLVRRPVRIALSMDEQFYTITKHGATVRIKTGVTSDGRMIAREVETYWNGGAYADIGPAGDAEVRLYRRRPVRHRARRARQLRRLHQRAAGRRAARLRHLAAGVGVRAAGRHHRAARSASTRSSSAAATPCARGVRMRPARSSPTWRSTRCSICWSSGWTGTARSIVAPAPSAAAAASRLASRRASRRRPRWPWCCSTATAAARCSAAPSTWARRRTRRWRRSSSEVLGIPTDIRARRQPGHGCHAVRHGDARIAIDVPHGQRGAGGCRGRTRARCCASRPRASATDVSELECVRRRGGVEPRRAHDAARDHARALRDAGRHHCRRRIVRALLQEAGSRHRPVARRDALLDARRRRRRDRRGHRDGAHRGDEAGERGGRRRVRSIRHRSISSSPAPPSCSSGSRCSKRWSSATARW